MSMSKQRAIAVTAYSSYLIVFYIILFLEVHPFSDYSSTFGLIGTFTPLPMLYAGLRCHSIEKRKPWFWFTVTALLYFIGEACWAYHTDVLGFTPESPSVCDVFYISNSITCFYAAICFIKQFHILLKEILFDVIISFLAICGMLFHYVFMPLLKNNETSVMELVSYTITSTVDLTLLAALLILILGADGQRFFTRRIFLLAVGILVCLGIDQATIAFSIYGLYDLPIGAAVEPLWSFGYWPIALASMYPDEDDAVLCSYSPIAKSFLAYFRTFLPYLLIFCILLFVGISHHLFNTFFLWGFILITCLSWRQISILLSNKQLLEHIKQSELLLNNKNNELLKLNQRIQRDAEVDFLTQLFNRRYIDQAFERMAPPLGKEQHLGVLLIDVDNFKQVNDKFGHQIGDQALQKVADCIRSVTRGSDIAGRFGGDEFIVLLPGADLHAVESVAGRLLMQVRENDILAELGATLSIGCASWYGTQPEYNAHHLQRQADKALYQAKEQGRNRYVLFETA